MSADTHGIERAVVFGAGVMGAGIAAHLANAGISVLLLDVPGKQGEPRNQRAASALAALRKADPAPLMHPSFAKRITPGNTEDDLEQLSRADWIIEAVIENLEIKQALYRDIDKVRKSGSLVSSNTSTLPMAALMEGLPDSLRRDFLITHFFNPPRYMRLLEIVSGPDSDPAHAARLADFADRRLGKSVIFCRDTPGFVANRIGTYWLMCAATAADDLGLSVEEADAVMSRPFGIPKTGVFALLDLVGLDLMPKVAQSMAAQLPAQDAYQEIHRDWPLLNDMISKGYTGRKGKGGFYRLDKSGGKRVKQAIDLKSGRYADAAKPLLESLALGKSLGLQALFDSDDRGGKYAWHVFSRLLSYAAELAPEIAENIHDLDRAMQLGYAWKQGPFQIMDKIGVDYLARRLREEGRKVAPLLDLAAKGEGFYRVHEGCLQALGYDGNYRAVTRPEGVLLLEDIKRRSEPLARNGSASLWDIGDEVACFEVHTKLNTLDPDVLSLLGKSLKIVAKDFKALVLYNEGSQFSAGANVGLALFAANTALWPMIEGLVEQGQKVYQDLKYAPFPCVAAPFGLTLGGGCEMTLASDAVQAHAESYVGLVEAGVGIVPAWGGCLGLLERYSSDPKLPKGPMAPVIRAFETIGLAKVAKSAFEARDLGFLRESDAVTFNRERLLADAKARALELARDYAPPEAPELRLPGESGQVTLQYALRDLAAKGVATPHDMVVAGALGEVLTGGAKADPTEPSPAKDILALERKAIMTLVRSEPTLQRMEHMLETGKPLRN